MAKGTSNNRGVSGKGGGKSFGKPGGKAFGKPGAKPMGKVFGKSMGKPSGGPPRPPRDRDDERPQQFEAGGERQSGPRREDHRGPRDASDARREGGAPPRGRPFAGLGGPGGPRPQGDRPFTPGDRPFRPGGPPAGGDRRGGFRPRDEDGDDGEGEQRPMGPRTSGVYRPENAGPMRPLVNGGMPRAFGPPTPRPGGPGAGGPGGPRQFGPRPGGPPQGGPRQFGPRPGGPPPAGPGAGGPGAGGPGSPRPFGPRPGGPPAGGPGFGGPRQFGPRPTGPSFGGPRRDDAAGRPFRPSGPPTRRFGEGDEPQDHRPRRQGPVGEMLYGRNAVLEALRGGRDIKRVFVATGAHGEVITEIVDTTRARKISLQSVDRRRLDDMAFNHQGVVAEAGPFQYASLGDVIEAAKASAAPLVLVLDVLQDPQNLGSLLRTAAAAGAQGVVIPEHRAVGVTPAVVKASAGAIERLKIAQVTNLSRAIEELQEAGLWSVGLDAEGDTPYDQADLVRPLALVVGGEGKGLRQLVRQHCDTIVRLPMPGAIESLNAAVAGSIVLYEALRQRANQPASSTPVGMRPVPTTVVIPTVDAVADEDDADDQITDSADVEFIDVDAAEAAAMEVWAAEAAAAEAATAKAASASVVDPDALYDDEGEDELDDDADDLDEVSAEAESTEDDESSDEVSEVAPVKATVSSDD